MKINKKIEIKNRKARFEYEILDRYTAGIVLAGTEIKAIRLGKASIAESFCEFQKRQNAISEVLEFQNGIFEDSKIFILKFPPRLLPSTPPSMHGKVFCALKDVGRSWCLFMCILCVSL